MAPSYADDHVLAHALVRHGLRAGARHFTADIEAPSAARDTPAYASWRALGFDWPYFRTHFVYG